MMKKKAVQIILLGALLFATACAVGSQIMGQTTPEPTYTIEQQEGAFEVRRYDPMIIAEVTVTGPRDKAINAGFRLLADYIFGNNTSAGKIAMTAPVIQQAASEKIAMTAPVLQEGVADNEWRVQFVMPPGSNMEALPKPNNKHVRLFQAPAQRAAVLRFSGLSSEKTIAAQSATLAETIKAKGLAVEGNWSLARYDPPWTLPWWRRNEIIQPLAP